MSMASEQQVMPFIESEHRVLVCGGRDYMNRPFVFHCLDRLARVNVNMVIIHGACCTGPGGKPTELTGADRWAQEWAQVRQFPYIGVPAKWLLHGRAAGPIRNEFMLERFTPNSVLALPGGAGTANMVAQAHKAKLIVWEPSEHRMRRPL